MIDRRHFALATAASLLLPGCARASAPREVTALQAALARIEQAAGGRLGVYVLDTRSGQGAGLRAGERFAMCSTFKLPLAALVLREAAAGRAALGERLAYIRADLPSHSPETGKHLAEGQMTIAALAEAAQTQSDNGAANLLLRRFGGPAGLTRFWREIGDTQSRLDRFEPDLNHVPPGELRDTTTPEAMARSVAQMLTGNVLAPADRARLSEWMARTATGMKRIRAALPAGWRAGDKTGTAGYPDLASKINDVAVLYPPGGAAPLVVAAFYETAASSDMRPQDEDVLRQVGKEAVTWAK